MIPDQGWMESLTLGTIIRAFRAPPPPRPLHQCTALLAIWDLSHVLLSSTYGGWLSCSPSSLNSMLFLCSGSSPFRVLHSDPSEPSFLHFPFILLTWSNLSHSQISQNGKGVWWTLEFSVAPNPQNHVIEFESLWNMWISNKLLCFRLSFMTMWGKLYHSP